MRGIALTTDRNTETGGRWRWVEEIVLHVRKRGIVVGVKVVGLVVKVHGDELGGRHWMAKTKEVRELIRNLLWR